MIDQGLAQAIWSARVHHGEHSPPPAVMSAQPKEWLGRTLFVHVKAPVNVARGRLARRQAHTSRFQDASRIDDQMLWTRAERAIDALAAEIGGELQRRGLEDRLLTITADDHSAPEANAARVTDQFASARRRTSAEPG